MAQRVSISSDDGHWGKGRFAKGGPPPEGSKHQCKGISLWTGNRCRKWALVNCTLCEYHGGRAQQRGVSNKGLPRFYSKVLGPKLKERFNELLEVSHSEHVQLHEELVLARIVCEQAVKIAAPILEDKEGLGDAAKVLAMSAMRDAVAGVREMVLATARVESMSRDVVSLHAMDLVIKQMVRVIYRTLGDDNEHLAKEIEANMGEIRLPTAESAGTQPIELDSQMKEMIGSVGAIPEIEEELDDGADSDS